MTSPQIITTTNKRVMSLSDHYRQNINEKIPPNKGEAFGGGYYIADITYADGRQFGIILAPKSGGENTYLIWKNPASNTDGTNSEDDGFANSEAMMSWGAPQHPAGNFCRSLSIGGFTDWYLPARNELLSVWDFRTNIPSGQEMNNWYWSSTQYDYSTAYNRNFSNGVQGIGAKNGDCYVRAIRRFPLN